MKKRSIALLLSAIVALGAAGPRAWAADAEESGSGERGWNGPSALTARLPEELNGDLNGAPEEPTDPADPLGVAYDLYLVAPAQDVPGYDAYTYDREHLGEGFEALAESFPDMETVDNAAWRTLAWSAAALVLDPGTEDVPARLLRQPREGLADLALDEPTGDLEPGLYLVIAHGKGMEPEEYIKALEPGEDGAARVGTIARSADYEYIFQPELVSLPGQNTTAEDEFDGTWNHEVTVTLKPDRELRYGQVRIRKLIDQYVLEEPATFVFSVTAEKDGKQVYENIVGLTFAAGGTGTEEVVLDRIPLGATVTAVEVYTGAFYQGTVTEQSGEVTLEILELTFENTRGPEEKRGHGIVNEFTYDGEDWMWTQDGRSPAEGEEG